jgi:hypothetical protein
VIEHIANGMYGAIIVDPASGWSSAKEYVQVQSELYTRKLSDGSYAYDNAKAMAVQPDYVTFNGYTNQYKDAPLTAQLGQRVRLFVLNAGPSEFSAFHVIGAMFVNTYVDGNLANQMVGNQTVTIPRRRGGGGVNDSTGGPVSVRDTLVRQRQFRRARFNRNPEIALLSRSLGDLLPQRAGGRLRAGGKGSAELLYS